MSQNPVPKIDWGGLETPSEFYGRDRELEELQKRILSGYRVVALVGMRGIGKTSLAMKLADQIKDKFDYVIARRLKNPPQLQELLGSWLQFFSNQENKDIPESIAIRIARVITFLRNHRCLLLLDDVEEILQAGKLVGQYQEEFKDYDNLFRQLGQAPHKSCLLLISREKPKTIKSLEDNTRAVTSSRLEGLDDAAAKAIFKRKGFSGSEARLTELINLYQGNPFKLNIVASMIQEVFGGSVTDFLDQATLDFDDIYNLLDSQFQRLSDLEKEIMSRLASVGQPVSLNQLRNQINKPGITDAIKSLWGRGLVETTEGEARYTLQGIVMKYVNRKLRR